MVDDMDGMNDDNRPLLSIQDDGFLCKKKLLFNCDDMGDLPMWCMLAAASQLDEKKSQLIFNLFILFPVKIENYPSSFE